MEPTVVETTNGPVEISFGVNRWVLVTTRYDSVQEQVSDEEAFARVLYNAGVPRSEAPALAAEVWRLRPREASLRSVSAGESAFRGTGLTRRGLLILIGSVVLGAIALTVLATTLR